MKTWHIIVLAAITIMMSLADVSRDADIDDLKARLIQAEATIDTLSEWVAQHEEEPPPDILPE